MKMSDWMKLIIICCFCITAFLRAPDAGAARGSLTAEEVQARIGEEIGAINRKIENLEESVGVLNERADISLAKSSGAEIELRNSLKEIADELAALKKEVGKLNLLYSSLEKKLDAKIAAVVNEVAAENEEIRKEIKAVKSAKSRTADQAGDTHTVKSGETLSAIAKSYGVTIVSLMEANDISDPNMIKIGDRIVIPKQ
ncbi:MAG: LysM peptidoglycan-binding domain-containing protein [bacterium]|nr:LysM peptidoglycan-binding domain-containing protein [bacterium]